MNERSESPADLLRRAAARLEDLDASAGAAPWQVDDEDTDELYVVCETALNGAGSYRSTDQIARHSIDNYGDSDDTYTDDPEYLKVRTSFDLIVTLRPVAAPLAVWLRVEADKYAGLLQQFGALAKDSCSTEAIAAARAVLGEQS